MIPKSVFRVTIVEKAQIHELNLCTSVLQGTHARMELHLLKDTITLVLAVSLAKLELVMTIDSNMDAQLDITVLEVLTL